MKRTLITILTLTIAISFIACSGTTGKGKTLATVGTATITEGDLELLGNINPRLKSQMATEFGRKKILDNLVEQEIFYQGALDKGIDKDKNVQDKIEVYKKVIISQSLLEQLLDEKAEEYYNQNKGDFEKLKLSHIYIPFKTKKNKNVKRTDKQALNLANQAKKKITGGADFATIAKEMSEDNITKKRGGDLGFASKKEPRLTRRGYGPVLEKAFTMKVGEVEGPIKTDSGYHVITVTSGVEAQAFDKAKQGILFKIRTNAKNEAVAKLKEKYKVAYTEKPKTTKIIKAPEQKKVPLKVPIKEVKKKN